MAVVVVHDSGLDGDLGGVVALTAHLVEEPLQRWRHLTILVTLGWTVQWTVSMPSKFWIPKSEKPSKPSN